MRIKPNEAVAVIVDVQERLFPHIHESERLAQNMVTLIKGLQLLEIPLLMTQQYTKGLGGTIPAILEVIDEQKWIEKMAFSCCGEPAFLAALRKTARKKVILLGIEAHVCVLQTAIDLLAHEFLPVVVEDCTGSRNPNNKRIAMTRIQQEGGILATYESILFELCMTSGTETFKAISRLVK